VGRDTKPLSFPVPYKVFLSQSVGGLFFENFSDLEQAIGRYRGQCINFHCENPLILSEHKAETLHGDRRPPAAEISAVEFILQLIKRYEIIGKIRHCSTRESFAKILEAKKRGVNVTAEVTPHHLYFDDSMLTDANRTLLQVNPPIRHSQENRLALIEALRAGELDYLATDHAPHTLEEKEKGASGFPGLDTYGPFAAWLMKEHDFKPEDVARVCAENPGKFFSQFRRNKYGKVKEGYVGSLTIIDMNKPVTITKENLKTKCGWSPFEGITFPGSVVMTVIKGKVYEHEK